MTNVLEIRGLTKRFEGFTLNNVSLSFPRGFIMGLIGPNGAGKTTLIKSVLNLLWWDSGEIRVFGRDIRTDEREIKQRIGFVQDSPRFYGYLTLDRFKSIVAPFYQDWDESYFRELIHRFNLPLDKRISHLSRGMKMKFALALALSHHPDLLVMDEPTTGLDPVFRRELLEHLQELLQDEGKSILFSTQITSDLERIADFVTFLRDGEIVATGPKDEYLEKWSIVKGGNEVLNEQNRKLFRSVQIGAYGFEALTDNIDQARRTLPTEVIFERPSLEDIMVMLVETSSSTGWGGNQDGVSFQSERRSSNHA